MQAQLKIWFNRIPQAEKEQNKRTSVFARNHPSLWYYALMIWMGWLVSSSTGMADIPPPSHMKRIQVRYHLLPPNHTDRYLFFLYHKPWNPGQQVELSPVVWNKTFSPPGGYRSTSKLVAIPLLRCQELIDAIKKLPPSLQQQAKLSSPDPKAILHWISQQSFSYEEKPRGVGRSIRPSLQTKATNRPSLAEHPSVQAFFSKATWRYSEPLYTQELTPRSSPAHRWIRVLQITEISESNISWKAVRLEKWDAQGKRVSAFRERGVWLASRWLWIAGFLAILFVFSFVLFRRKSF